MRHAKFNLKKNLNTLGAKKFLEWNCTALAVL